MFPAKAAFLFPDVSPGPCAGGCGPPVSPHFYKTRLSQSRRLWVPGERPQHSSGQVTARRGLKAAILPRKAQPSARGRREVPLSHIQLPPRRAIPRRRGPCLCRILLSNASPHPYMGKNRPRGFLLCQTSPSLSK